MKFVIYNATTGIITGRLSCSPEQAAKQTEAILEITNEEWLQPLEQTKKVVDGELVDK